MTKTKTFANTGAPYSATVAALRWIHDRGYLWNDCGGHIDFGTSNDRQPGDAVGRVTWEDEQGDAVATWTVLQPRADWSRHDAARER